MKAEILIGKTIKSWSATLDKWMYSTDVAYINEDGLLKTDTLYGWSFEEVDKKIEVFEKALNDLKS